MAEPIRLTAEAYAQAIVAAARVFGDDPERAVTALSGPLNRCLAPALAALAEAAERPLAEVAGPMGASASNITRALDRGGASTDRAQLAALDALKRLRRTVPPPPAPAPAPGPGTLSGRILEALADGAHTTSGLAVRLGVKELPVCHALAQLQREGLASAGAIPSAGRRGQYWRLAR